MFALRPGRIARLRFVRSGLVLAAWSLLSVVPSTAQACTPGDVSDCAPPDSCLHYICVGNGLCDLYYYQQCFDGNPCTDDNYCPHDQCVYRPLPDGAACQGNRCGTGGTCQAGACVGAQPKDCSDGNPCSGDTCDPMTGSCSHNGAVSCDDGNICTQDSCSSMNGCVHTAVSGLACDDRDGCTSMDTCVVGPNGQGLCKGTPPPCADDGNACTDDIVEPGSCACVHVPKTCAEPGPLTFNDAVTLAWSASQGAAWYNVYRGTIPEGLMGSRAPGSVYDHGCFTSVGATYSIDQETPLPASGFYYLVSGRNECAESALGESDSGGGPSAPIPNPAPCP
jgi:Dictyostelium (slime mold) repeat